MSDDCPCRGCTTETGRSPTCHGTCDMYVACKEKVAAEKECLLNSKSEIDKYESVARTKKWLDNAMKKKEGRGRRRR